MMLTRVMFRPIISQICARSPLYLKLFLSIFILQPMKTYVHWFRCFQMDVPIDHHICGRNFRQCGCWWLWISHILQGFVYWHCIFGIDENCSQLGFGRQLHYRSYDLIDIQYHSILGWEVVISQNKIITSHSTPCLQFVEIGRIDVDIKHHVACSIYEDGVRLCHWIIEDFFIYSLCYWWVLIVLKWLHSGTSALSHRPPWNNPKMCCLLSCYMSLLPCWVVWNHRVVCHIVYWFHYLLLHLNGFCVASWEDCCVGNGETLLPRIQE